MQLAGDVGETVCQLRLPQWVISDRRGLLFYVIRDRLLVGYDRIGNLMGGNDR